MQIAECHFDLPLFVVSEGNDVLAMNAEKGKYLCLFTEELFAERAKSAGQLIRGVDSWKQLHGFINAVEPTGYAGVCFDFQSTTEGPRSKFAFNWDEFKDAVREHAAKPDR